MMETLQQGSLKRYLIKGLLVSTAIIFALGCENPTSSDDSDTDNSNDDDVVEDDSGDDDGANTQGKRRWYLTAD